MCKLTFNLLVAFFAIIAIGEASFLSQLIHNVREATVGRRSNGSEFNGNLWALLVAGSNGYYNYRHQADVFHAYHVLTDHGFPKENIIVMAYDDIAYSEENPTPGVVINKPNGTDIYGNVTIDYKGRDVTPDTFLSVLSGDAKLKKQGKKVISSGADDHVFVYFADHGAPGLIAFPTDELHARKLNKVLNTMHQKKSYNKLVFYLEACESGSMFDGLLPGNLSIFAVTAANDAESSYACYWDEYRETYLGDVFSVNWLENSDQHASLNSETLSEQFKIVRKETNTSHVLEFGDLSIGKLSVAQFQGEYTRKYRPSAKVDIQDAIPSHDVPLYVTKKKLEKARRSPHGQSLAAKLESEYKQIIRSRYFLVNSIKSMANTIKKHLRYERDVTSNSLFYQKFKLTQHDCYEELVTAFDSHCFDLSEHPYALRYLYVLVNTCEKLVNPDPVAIKQLTNVIKDECSKKVSNHPFKKIQ